MEFVAREIMTAPVITVGPEAKLAEAVKVMAEKNISGLPVVDEDNRVIGIISEADIVDYAGKTQAVRLFGSSGWISPYDDRIGSTSYRKGFELLANTPVEKVMARKVTTVKEDTPGLEVARVMNRKKINRVPVVDASGRLVGHQPGPGGRCQWQARGPDYPGRYGAGPGGKGIGVVNLYWQLRKSIAVGMAPGLAPGVFLWALGGICNKIEHSRQDFSPL